MRIKNAIRIGGGDPPPPSRGILGTSGIDTVV
jgi:hypothetical protein